MKSRTSLGISLMMFATLVVTGCGQDSTEPTNAKATAVDSPIDAKLFIELCEMDRIREEFPIKAGMTVAEVEKLLERQDSLAYEKELGNTYNLGWKKYYIHNGNGWMYFWVNGKSLLHCDLVVEKNRVKSVWVMPGNDEYFTMVYYRLSGSGPHEIEGRSTPSPSWIETDEQLSASQTPLDMDHLCLHGSKITNNSMKLLTPFTNLRDLSFNYPGITDDGLKYIQKLKNLRKLSLGTVNMTDDGLAYVAALTELEELSLWNNHKITDTGLKYLKNLKHLKKLNLDGTSITEQGVKQLKKSLPNCRIIEP